MKKLFKAFLIIFCFSFCLAGGAFFIGCDSAKDLSPQTITITLDSNGGKIAENENWMIVENNATKTIQISGDVAYYETLPDATTVTREGYEFLGWFTKIEGGENITATSQITNKSSPFGRVGPVAVENVADNINRIALFGGFVPVV